jgi:hypothetical protein
VTVTSPNTAVQWRVGSLQQIKWTHNLGLPSAVRLELSRDGGASWSVIADDVPNTASTSGAYAWTVPGPATTTARIRVAWTAGSAADQSNVDFFIRDPYVTVTAPNTAVDWRIGSIQQIKWQHNLVLPSRVRIEISRDGGASWAIIADEVANTATTSGAYAWTVTGPAVDSARVRVSWTSGPATDVSDVNFRISNPFITVTTPGSSTNWGYGTRQKQTWTTNLGASDPVKVLLSVDGGATFPLVLVSGTAASLKSAIFVVPALAAPTALARIRVEAVADAAIGSTSPANFRVEPPFIQVTAPNVSGTLWKVGYGTTVRWTSNLGLLENVAIALSRDGGSTFDPVLTPATPSDGAQAFTVLPEWVTENALVRIAWAAQPAVVDASDAIFFVR